MLFFCFIHSKWELGHTVCDILVYKEENIEEKKGENIEKVLNM